jgi:ferredoxin
MSFAHDPDVDLGAFAADVKREQPEQILIACCAAPETFSTALAGAEGRVPRLHYLNWKELCFSVHSDAEQTHAKASRLLRAAVKSAERKETPAYNPLRVGGQIFISADTSVQKKLAEQLRGTAKLSFLAPPEAAPHDDFRQVARGRITEIKGRLGAFLIVVEADGTASRRELNADQVIMISTDNGLPPFKTRTGCHLLVNPSEEELRRVGERAAELIGEFSKPVEVSYTADICAGGAANLEACGACVGACPYDAIGRDPENHLRVKIDHMACEGCGACVSACPTGALRFTEPSPDELDAAMAALLAPLHGRNGDEPLTLLFHCGEEGRRTLEAASRQTLSYPASVLPVEVPCLRFVSEAHILEAFRLGAAGVGLLGCETCRHGERELLGQKLDFCRVTLDAFGLGSERLRLITADESARSQAVGAISGFAQTVSPTPIRFDAQPAKRDHRQVIAQAVKTFIGQLGREPGRRPLASTQPYAVVEVNEAGCTLCRSCVNVCPTHAFSLDEKNQSLNFKHISCVACGLCEKVCPEHVITLRHEVYFDKSALDDLTVVQDRMVSCLKCGKPYVNQKALEAVEARLLPLESLLDTFAGNRRGLLRMCPDCRAVDAMLEVEKGWKP